MWIVENGDGNISNNSDPNNAFYTPTAQDFQNGSVQIKLSVTGSAPCNNVVSQTFTIAMFQELTVNAGPNRLFCENDPNFTIDDVTVSDVNDVLSYQWSVDSGPATILGGTENQINPTIIPSGAGSITLELVVTPNAPCSNPQTVQKTLTSVVEPQADAGADQEVCIDLSNNVVVNLNGNASDLYEYQSYSWTGGNGGNWSTANQKTATYAPSQADLSAGSVVLTFTVGQGSSCSEVSDQITIFFFEDIEITAGDDITVCEDRITITSAQLINPVPNTPQAIQYPVSYQWTQLTPGDWGHYQMMTHSLLVFKPMVH